MAENRTDQGSPASSAKQPTPPPLPIVTPPEKLPSESLDLNNVEVIDDLNINRWLMRIMRLGASYVSTGSNGYRTSGSISSSSSGSRSRRLSVTMTGNDTSASNLLRPPNTSRGRRFSDSMNFDVIDGHGWSKTSRSSSSRKGLR